MRVMHGFRDTKQVARCLAVALFASLLCCGAALAGSARSARNVAGVRATISQYDSDLLDGNGKAGCALLTSTAQKQIAKQNHVTSCELVFEAAASLFKSAPKQAAAVRAYAGKVHVTISGNTATVPQLTGSGHVTLTYTKGLWFVSSEG
jgi:hypothetical protein